MRLVRQEREDEDLPSAAEIFSSKIVELSTMGWSTDLLGVGAGPTPLDVYESAILLPPKPSLPDNRYFVRLLATQVAAGEYVRPLGFRQMLTIGDLIDGWAVEADVVSPLWKFPDGNVSWHIGWIKGIPGQVFPGDPPGVTVMSTSRDLYGETPALLYTGTDDGQFGRPYTAPAFPVGYESFGNYATIRDMRAPWNAQGTREDFGPVWAGPGYMFLWATVKQTDPQTRAPFPATIDCCGIRPEDLFCKNVPTAVYRHIAGALIFERGLFKIGRPELEVITGGVDT